jgi:hypothetical protein
MPSSMEPLPTVAAVSVLSAWLSFTAVSGTSENALCSPETPRDLDHEQKFYLIFNRLSLSDQTSVYKQ